MPNNVRSAILLAGALGALAGEAAAQQRIAVQGLATGELWTTSHGSRLLERNGGKVGTLGNLALWTGVSPGRNLLFVALLEGEAGPASTEKEAELEVEMMTLKWNPSSSLAVEAGRLVSPLGAFGPRRLSSANPLIGIPDVYPVSYPWGVQWTGALGKVDFRVAAVDKPASNPKYVPEGSSWVRPVGGIGYTPFIGVRIGGSFTVGPYLGSQWADQLPDGESWQSYDQRILSFDLTVSRGYLELRAEGALTSYDVPGHPEPVNGEAGYLEVKYTFTPRFYAAVRIEHNDYAFIRAQTDGVWRGSATTFRDAELGVGYRLAPRTRVKASLRMDDWDVPPALQAILQNGHAVAIQVSQGFDLSSLIPRF